MEPFKNLYNKAFFEYFTATMQQVYPAFDAPQFMAYIYDNQWADRELKQRMRHITEGLHQQLPASFEQSCQLITAAITQLQANGVTEHSVEYMFFPDYIQCYGLNHMTVACQAIAQVTQFTSCEFAVRPFIIQYPEAMLAQMLAWSTHANYKVRRLASEGCRPRLPWAMALPALKEDPAPILPILENLKNDPTDFVRRSVGSFLRFSNMGRKP